MYAQWPACLLYLITASNDHAGKIKNVTNQRLNLQSRWSFYYFKVEESKHNLNGNTNALIHLQLIIESYHVPGSVPGSVNRVALFSTCTHLTTTEPWLQRTWSHREPANTLGNQVCYQKAKIKCLTLGLSCGWGPPGLESEAKKPRGAVMYRMTPVVSGEAWTEWKPLAKQLQALL